jgi:hypothetical protein
MAKPGKLGYCGSDDEVKKGRGDSRQPPLDMEDDKDWPNFQTRKLGFRHGDAGQPVGGKKEWGGGK